MHGKGGFPPERRGLELQSPKPFFCKVRGQLGRPPYKKDGEAETGDTGHAQRVQPGQSHTFDEIT